MGLLLFLNNFFSKFAGRPGWIRLHRFPTDEEDGDDENMGRFQKTRYHINFKFIFLLVGIITASIVAVKIIDPTRFTRPQISISTSVVPMWASNPESDVTPVLGESFFDFGMYFPAQGNNFLPLVASYNEPPRHRPKTPLFIPFTRNNGMMVQTVLGYIAGGWPREDIIIIDNSGTADANNLKLLSRDNPFFLDYDLFRFRYGVSILQTSVLLNFAQIQNFMLRVAMARHWTYFFWSHMDVAVLSHEEETPYTSFYQRVLGVLDESESQRRAGESKWAVKFFMFDTFTMINVEAWRHIGQWDVFIPYYTTDCDAYGRVKMNGFTIDEAHAGHIWDVNTWVEDAETKFFPPAPQPKGEGDNDSAYQTTVDNAPNSARFQALRDELQAIQDAKKSDSKGRNTWQNMQKGGKGEPWTYDPAGFQVAWWEMADYGRQLFEHKWGGEGCDIFEAKKTMDDMWKGAGDEE